MAKPAFLKVLPSIHSLEATELIVFFSIHAQVYSVFADVIIALSILWGKLCKRTNTVRCFHIGSGTMRERGGYWGPLSVPEGVCSSIY